MENAMAGDSNPQGTDIAGAAQAFAKILSGSDAGEREEGEAPSTLEVDTPEPLEAEGVEAEAEIADDEGEEGQSDDDDGEAEAPATRKFTVKLDGKDIEVDEQELLQGYQRTADYTRKTQELANQRKAAEAELAAIRAEREQYQSVLPAIQQLLESQMGAQPDWDRLYVEDPIEWVRQRELWRDKVAQVEAVRSEQARLGQLQQAEQAQRIQQTLSREQEALLAKLPEWRDAERAKADKAAILEYGVREIGFAPEELNAVYDHRAVVLLRKAMAYDKLMAKQVKPTNPAPRAIRPGNASPPGQRQATEQTRARQRLAKTGRVEDAAAIFKGLL